ncbi:unnamed protein product [Boreogadus saida]
MEPFSSQRDPFVEISETKAVWLLLCQTLQQGAESVLGVKLWALSLSVPWDPLELECARDVSGPPGDRRERGARARARVLHRALVFHAVPQCVQGALVPWSGSSSTQQGGMPKNPTPIGCQCPGRQYWRLERPGSLVSRGNAALSLYCIIIASLVPTHFPELKLLAHVTEDSCHRVPQGVSNTTGLLGKCALQVPTDNRQVG